MGDVFREMGGAILATAYLILLCTIAELLSRRDEFRWHHRWPGILFGLLVPIFSLVMSWPLRTFWNWLGVEPLISFEASAWLGNIGATLAMLLFYDFLQYWEHRFEHRFLWPVHAVHHSVENLSAATSYSHPLQFISMFLLISVPLSLVDFGSPAVAGAVLFLSALLPVFIHSPVRFGFGPLRHLIVDPQYHRLHHSLEERHFDRNFSIIFSFWDRMFGTMTMPHKDEWPDTGIHEARSPRTVSELLAFPFRLWFADKPAAPASPQVAASALQEPDVAANRQAA